MVDSGLEPYHRYMEENSLTAMLATKRSAAVAPEVNLREHLTQKYLCQVQLRLPLWLWNPEETSPKVQNSSISSPIKKTYVLQKHLKKHNSELIWHQSTVYISTWYVWRQFNWKEKINSIENKQKEQFI